MGDHANQPSDDAWEVGVGVVRPYLFTQGRTLSDTRPLAVEAMVVATGPPDEDLAPEQRKLIELCDEPRSVAEVAAKLSIPLGVVQVLIADLTGSDAIEICRQRNGHTLADDIALLQRLIVRVKSIP
ncbi:MAG TPA: DUF742 domain-containing protein [Acidimicrobiales bacterium]|jgi:hypothetical protein